MHMRANVFHSIPFQFIVSYNTLRDAKYVVSSLLQIPTDILSGEEMIFYLQTHDSHCVIFGRNGNIAQPNRAISAQSYDKNNFFFFNKNRYTCILIDAHYMPLASTLHSIYSQHTHTICEIERIYLHRFIAADIVCFSASPIGNLYARACGQRWMHACNCYICIYGLCSL